MAIEGAKTVFAVENGGGNAGTTSCSTQDGGNNLHLLPTCVHTTAKEGVVKATT